MPSPEENLDILNDLVNRATRLGADAADALMLGDTSIGLARRLGNQEQLERSEGRDLGLRVLIGKRQAIVSSSDCSAKVLKDLAERAVSMAGAVPEDPHCGLADPDLLQRDPPEIDSCDPVEPTPEQMTEMGARAEAAARSRSGCANSGSASSAGDEQASPLSAPAAPATYAGRPKASRFPFSPVAVEQDYDHTAANAGGHGRPGGDWQIGGRKGSQAIEPAKSRNGAVPIVTIPGFPEGSSGACLRPSTARPSRAA